MSYVEQLMEVAAKWMKLNPSASGMLKMPHLHDVKVKNSAQDLDRVARKLEAAAPQLSPETRARMQQELAKAKENLAVMQATLAEVKKLEDRLEYQVNETEATRLQKSSVDGITMAKVLSGRWCLAWAYAGYNVFELSDDFVAAMLLTDPREIRFDDLRAPFPGILINIPAGFVTGSEGLSYTRLHLSYVDDSWCLYASDGVHVLHTSIAEGEKLSWALLEGLRDLEELGEPLQGDADAQAVKSIQQIAFGMLAYVTAVERARQERPAPGTKKSRKLNPGPRLRIHDVGRDVKIDPILVKHAKAGANEVALQLKHRFIVRGHYRNQAHGPGRAERTRRWIAPHWRGPEEGARLVHTYKPELST